MSWDRIVGKWYFNDLLGHKGELPSPSFGIFYTKCLMDIIAADGVISDKQRNWVIGFAAISGKYILLQRKILYSSNKIGYSDEVILQIAKYDPTRDKEGIQILQSDMDEDYVKLSRLSLIYNAFRAAGADGEIHEKQAEAISALGRRLGATIEEIQKVRLLYDEEIQLRKKRAAVLVPKRLNTVLSELKHAK